MCIKLTSQATLFYDGLERSENNKICEDVSYADNGPFTVKVSFDLTKLNKDVFQNSFTFDPLESAFIKIYNIKIFCDDVLLDKNKIKPLNAKTYKDSDISYFLTSDPIYSLRLPVSQSVVVVYDAEIISPYELTSFINRQRMHNSKCTRQAISSIVNKFRRFSHKQDRFIHPLLKQISDNSLLISKCSLKKMLFVVHSDAKHGPVLLFKNFVSCIKNNFGIQPIIIVLTHDENNVSFENLGVTYNLDLSYFDINLRASLLEKILKEIHGTNCSLAICNSLTTGIITDLLKENGFTITQLVHEMPELVEFNNLINAASLSFRNSDNLVFPSDYVLQQYIERGLDFNGETYIIPQGLYNVQCLTDFSEKAFFKEKICKKLGCDENSNIIIGCGTGYLVKGIDYFVDVAINVITKLPNAQFVWIGHFDQVLDNMGKTLAHRQIKLAGLDDNIHLFDFVDNPADYFAAADVYFLPSRNDTFPSSVLEAAASFTPSVIFEGAGGAQDFIEDGKNGKIVNYCNIEESRDSIISLLLNPDLLKDLACNANSKSSKYTMDDYVKSLLKICNN